jgi:hypothetical protein
VTSLTCDELSPQTALKISRGHWRCENCTHFAADAELHEDQRRISWSRHPHGVLAAAAVRMMALTILAVCRQMSRFGYSQETRQLERRRGTLLAAVVR